ncbi:MAG: hypothetical protein U1D67_06695 [Dehalococcoidia bacterium]|nr:hypothetical protein [Dehalococcoidia bacterium]
MEDNLIGISYPQHNEESMGPYCIPCAEAGEESGEGWPTGNTDSGLSTEPTFSSDPGFTCVECGEFIGEEEV